MTPLQIFVELLARVGAGGDTFISELELNRWPTVAVKALKTQKLITKAPPARSVICPGCEEACTMNVEQGPISSGTADLFIVCDKRDDINRVAIQTEQVIQWLANGTSVARFVAQGLSLRWNGKPTKSANALQIGTMRGKKKSQVLCLGSENGMSLMAGSNQVPLAELIEYTAGLYLLDAKAITNLVDASTTSDPRYTPSNARREARKLETSQRYEAWGKEYRKLKKRKPNMSKVWYATQISRMDIADGKSPDTIRKNMT